MTTGLARLACARLESLWVNFDGSSFEMAELDSGIWMDRSIGFLDGSIGLRGRIWWVWGKDWARVHGVRVKGIRVTEEN